MEWLYQGRPVVDDDLVGNVAFVYRITNTTNQKQYIGKKRLEFYRRKKIKGKKNRKKIVSPSDWRTYYGSNDALTSDLDKMGMDTFKREIIQFARTLGEASYLELYYQVIEKVLFQPDKYYNSIVQCRIHRKHVINLKVL